MHGEQDTYRRKRRRHGNGCLRGQRPCGVYNLVTTATATGVISCWASAKGAQAALLPAAAAELRWRPEHQRGPFLAKSWRKPSATTVVLSSRRESPPNRTPSAYSMQCGCVRQRQRAICESARAFTQSPPSGGSSGISHGGSCGCNRSTGELFYANSPKRYKVVPPTETRRDTYTCSHMHTHIQTRARVEPRARLQHHSKTHM